MQLTFSGGLGTPRLIAVGFQFAPDGTTPDLFNNSIYNCRKFHPDNMINDSSAVLHLNGTPFIKQDYQRIGSSGTDDMERWRWTLHVLSFVDINNFVNLYCLYVFDITKPKWTLVMYRWLISKYNLTV